MPRITSGRPLGGCAVVPLPLDHRDSFQKDLFSVAVDETPGPVQPHQIRDFRTLIYEGLEEALTIGAPTVSAAVLVDEQFGAEIARRAKATGLILALPVERSGQDEYDFEYGNAFAVHIDGPVSLIWLHCDDDLSLELRPERTPRPW